MSKGVSFDEGLQLAVGYNIWINDDFRIEGANGDLIKRWATLPYLISRPHFVGREDRLWRESRSYELAKRFLFELGNSPEALLLQGRAMVVVLGVLTGVLVFACSRELFGPSGGLISLAVYAFDPSMLAFGGIVSTDMSITLTLFGATLSIWKLLHEITLTRLLTSLGCVSLMVLAKPTALVIFPITALLVAARLMRNEPLPVRWRDATEFLHRRRAQFAAISLLGLLHVAAGWGAIWAHYGFRYHASPEPSNPTLQFFSFDNGDVVPPPLLKTLNLAEKFRLLPEGFRVGVHSLLTCDDALGSFMNGEWSVEGRPAFFPYAIWVKTPPTLFLLLGVAAVTAWRSTPHLFRFLSAPRSQAPFGYGATPHFALIGCYLAVAMTEDLNIGHRHVLPIYPSLFVLTGAVAVYLPRQWWTRALVGLSLAVLAFESFAVRPHYLAYFGPQAGGPSNGYKHLVDSSLEWGMDLPALRRWIDEHDPAGREPLFLAYFGTDRPSHYGIRARRLPGFLERREFKPTALLPGYYAISATLFQAVHTSAFGGWSKAHEELFQGLRDKIIFAESTAANSQIRQALLQQTPDWEWRNIYDQFVNLRFARLCSWLRRQGDPPHQVAHSILIWKLDQASLEAALLGPPAELVNAPLYYRRHRVFTAASTQ